MGGTSQPWMAPQPQQAPPDQPAALTPTAQPAAPAPINLPDPGSTSDLEQRASQGPQALGQQLQQQFQPDPNVATAQRIAQTQGIAPKVNLSDGNPYSDLYNQAYTKYQAAQPAPTADRAARVRSLMQNFFSGMGESMMHEAGLVTPTAQRQQDFQNLTTLGQLAEGWENHKDLQNYHNTLTAAEQQRMQFEAQMQPLRLQAERQVVTGGQQGIPTVQPVVSAEDLNALGVPSDLASQYAGKPLNSADMGSLRQMAVAGQKQLFDYGQDGQGPNRGIWLMDKNYAPIKQLATISETGRSVAAARIQAQAQNNLIKSASAPVYAYDPTSKQTVLTTMGDARNGGMQAVRGVKETDIRNDTHDTRVLNDVAVKSNNLLDASAALDQNQSQRDMINWAMAQAEKDNQFKVGAFGTQFPTGWFNSLLNSSNMGGASQLTKDYVVSVLSLREAAMGMQKVLTGSARANEAQINALQATVPGLETNSALARQKLAAFTQNVDMLRQGIPRMPGIDVVPIKAANHAGTAETTGAEGFNWNSFPLVGAPK
jgi:hypothetical protein